MRGMILLSLSLGLILPACSDKQMYEGLRKRNEADCYRLPVAQQQDCIEQSRNVDYDEYQRALKKAAE